MLYHSGNELVDPYLLFEKVQLAPDMHIADFGCGRTGHIVFPAASVVGEKGVVYGVDILKEVLDIIRKRANLNQALPIHPIWSDIEVVGKTAIPAGSLDVVFLVDVLSQLGKRIETLDEAMRLLKQKARIVIVDWTDGTFPLSPGIDNLLDFDRVKEWAGANNFFVQEEFPVSKYQTGMVLYRHE